MITAEQIGAIEELVTKGAMAALSIGGLIRLVIHDFAHARAEIKGDLHGRPKKGRERRDIARVADAS